jgi:hypothetical protein
MSIYNFDIDYLTEKLTPPVLRQSRIIAFLKVICRPLQLIWKNTEKYFNGSGYAIWSNVTTYNRGDKVRYGYEIYDALQSSTGEVPFENTDYWLMINKDFVGLDARARFNGGKMLFEYILNLYLNTTYATLPTIYTTRNTVDVNGFFMGTDGASELGELGTETNQDDFLGTTTTINQYAMTIYVPSALYTSLATTSADREARVRNIADRYVYAGIQYNVTTY